MEQTIQNYDAMVLGIQETMSALIADIASVKDDVDAILERTNKAEKAFKTLDKVTSATHKVMKMRLEIEEKKRALAPPADDNDYMTPQDFEIIIRAAKQFGLLKDGAEDMVDQIVNDLYERDQPVKINRFDEIDCYEASNFLQQAP